MSKASTTCNIKESNLYKDIVNKIGGANVHLYKLSYYYHGSDTGVNFKGRGDINWDEIEKAIDNINNKCYKYSKSKKNTDRNHLLYVNLNSYDGKDLEVAGKWTALITLNNGNWITIESKYDKYNDDYFSCVVLHEIPVLELPPSDFSYSVEIEHNNTSGDFYLEEDD